MTSSENYQKMKDSLLDAEIAGMLMTPEERQAKQAEAEANVRAKVYARCPIGVSEADYRASLAAIRKHVMSYAAGAGLTAVMTGQDTRFLAGIAYLDDILRLTLDAPSVEEQLGRARRGEPLYDDPELPLD